MGRPLVEAELRTRWKVDLLAVRRAGAEHLEILPPLDYVVQEGDVLLLVGPDARLATLTK